MLYIHYIDGTWWIMHNGIQLVGYNTEEEAELGLDNYRP